MNHYAEAFTFLPGQGLSHGDRPRAPAVGQPTHLDRPVVWRSRFRSRGADLYRVDARADHDGLTRRTAVIHPEPENRSPGHETRMGHTRTGSPKRSSAKIRPHLVHCQADSCSSSHSSSK